MAGPVPKNTSTKSHWRTMRANKSAARVTPRRERVPIRTESTARISNIRDVIPNRVPTVACGLKLAALKTPRPAKKN